MKTPFALSFAIGLAFLPLLTGTPLHAQALSVVRGPYLQMWTDTSIVVRWRTNQPVVGRVRYGTQPGALNTFIDESAPVTDHEIQITGLQPRSLVFYSIGTPSGVLAGDDADHYFKTLPPPGARDPLRLWVIGDSGTGNANARRVRDGYLTFAGPRHTDLWVMLGDNAYFLGTDQEYQTAVFQNMYEAILRTSSLWSTFGNHDAFSANSLGQTGPYYDIFTLPTQGEAGGVPSGTEAYYSFDQGNVHFVCLDSSESDRSPTGAMALWLQADLAATNQDWIIAFWHHPPYSKGSHDSDTEGRLIDMRQNFVPILEAYGVDLVLCGHSHSYERSMLLDGHYGLSSTFDPATMAPDAGTGILQIDGAYRKPSAGLAPHEGAVYTVCGSSGQATPAPLNHPVMIQSLPLRGSVVLDVNGLQLDLRFIDEQGLVWDHVTLTKGPAAPVAIAHTPINPLGTWRYEDSGTDLGTAWRQPSFDDSSWAAGQAPLGYGEIYINTTVSFGPDPFNKQPTTYFRKTFTIDHDPALVSALRLAVNFDDGYVAYLNGQEVARRSMPAGPVAYGTLALPHEGGVYEMVDLSAHAGLLVPGQNLLAVEVHQFHPASSDLVFDALLYYDAYVPHLPQACAAGSLPSSVLTINGSDGGPGRGVDVGVGESLALHLATPQTHPGSAAFALFGYLGAPPPGNAWFLGPGGPALCFTPAWLAPQDPSLFALATSLPVAPPAVVPASGTPFGLVLPAGISVPMTLTFQALVEETPGVFGASNAIQLRVLP